MVNGQFEQSVVSHSPFTIDGSQFYSVLNDFTGFATAALMAWRPTVNNAIIIAPRAVLKNIHQLMPIL